jgi:hypothetical protein
MLADTPLAAADFSEVVDLMPLSHRASLSGLALEEGLVEAEWKHDTTSGSHTKLKKART